MKKYELIDHDGTKAPKYLKQLRALVDIPGRVRAGQLGGFVESENNLSQVGRAWVSDSACVSDSAHVSGSARVYGSACIRSIDEIQSSKDYFVIQGFDHNVTVTANSIHVGCQDFTPEQLDEHFDHPESEAMKAMIEIALAQILEESMRDE